MTVECALGTLSEIEALNQVPVEVLPIGLIAAGLLRRTAVLKVNFIDLFQACYVEMVREQLKAAFPRWLEDILRARTVTPRFPGPAHVPR